VRVSLVGFGKSEQRTRLNGESTAVIAADLAPNTAAGTSAVDLTMTKLYNERPSWLAQARWADYTPQMADEEILRRLLALNRGRSAASLS
jgi:hypothetical protein